MRNTSRNIAYQGLFQIVKTVLPLISIPIISHSLGAESVGEYSFYNSIIQYFILMAAIGIPLYGVREIAKVRDTRYKLSKLFCEIEVLNFTMALLIALVAIIVGLIFKYPNIYFIQIFLIIGNGIDISWLFMGLEDFSKVTIANTLIAILSVVLLYLNVHSPSDLVFYTFLMTFTIVIGQIMPWIFVKKYVYLVDFKISDSFKHVRETIALFLPQVSILIYTVVNKIILGFYAGNVSVAIYSNAMFIVSSLVVLIGVVDTAFLPRVSYQVQNNDYQSAAKTLEFILQVQAFMNIGIIFGIISVSKQFIPWFFGSSFGEMKNILPLLICAIFFITSGTSLSRQFFVPTNKLKEYNKIVIIGAVVSLALNFITIPIWGVFGATVTTVFIEGLLWIIESIYFYNETGLLLNFKMILKNMMAGIGMYVVIKLLFGTWKAGIITTVCEIIIGVIIYFVINHFLKSNILYALLKKKSFSGN